jgi:hypothetical protein
LSITTLVPHLGQEKPNFLFSTFLSSTAYAALHCVHRTTIAISWFFTFPGNAFHLYYAELLKMKGGGKKSCTISDPCRLSLPIFA